MGFIGSGMIGGTVARLSVAAGHQVVLSNSRGPQTLADLVKELGPRARAATREQTAEAGDIVVVAIPFGASAERSRRATQRQGRDGHRQLLPPARRPARRTR